jgi:hypothetical protein
MLIDNLKWVSESNEILELIQENFPELVLTDEYFQEYKNLQVAETGKKGIVVVKFDTGDKTIVCGFSEVMPIFVKE